MSSNDSSIDFIRDKIGDLINHVIRNDERIKNIAVIEMRDDGNYNVKYHRGTEDEVTTLEGISKERLLEIMK